MQATDCRNERTDLTWAAGLTDRERGAYTP